MKPALMREIMMNCFCQYKIAKRFLIISLYFYVTMTTSLIGSEYTISIKTNNNTIYEDPLANYTVLTVSVSPPVKDDLLIIYLRTNPTEGYQFSVSRLYLTKSEASRDVGLVAKNNPTVNGHRILRVSAATELEGPNLVTLDINVFESVKEIQDVFWVAPTGQGSLCTYEAPCSLYHARDLVRDVKSKLDKDIYIKLRGGIYPLDIPFILTPMDSGANGNKIVYQAFTGDKLAPVLSGGVEVNNFSHYKDGIWRAPLSANFDTRQLYVDGKRAVRARGIPNPQGFQITSTGFATLGTEMLEWGKNNLEQHKYKHIEVTGFRNWKHFRCPLKSITRVNGVTHLNVDDSCWYSSQEHKNKDCVNNKYYRFDHTFNTIARVENALELLDEEGEWYLDRDSSFLYYKPIVAKNPNDSTVYASRLETLVEATGYLDENDTPVYVRDITFRGITFSHATWLSPNKLGYAETQAGWHNKNKNFVLSKTPGNIVLRRAKNILFERNKFIHLGGAALNIENRSQDIRIIGNRFEDISSSAIQIGDIEEHSRPTYPAPYIPGCSKGLPPSPSAPPSPLPEPPTNQRTARIFVSNNYITRAAVEFNSAVGIFVGQTENTRLEHNEISELPYTGISIGWGWDYGTFMKNNTIYANRIYKVMNKLRDGAAIYTLNHQKNTKIIENWIHDLGVGSQQPDPDTRFHFAAIYHDLGSHFFSVKDNVFERVTIWLSKWSDQAMENTITNNWMDKDLAWCKSLVTGVRSNQIVESKLCNFGGPKISNNYAKTSSVTANTALSTLSEVDLINVEKVKANAGIELRYRDIR